MNASHKYRKLRTINSLETDCTLDDNLDRSIKIKVLSPKGESGSGKLDLVPEEMTQMRDLLSSREGLDRNLMEVPELCRKQPQISLLDASNTTEQVHGERIRISNKSMYPGSDCFDDSMNFREMIITNGSKNLASDGQLAGLGLIKNNKSLQRSGKLSSKNSEGFFRQNFKSQQFEEDRVNTSLVELEVDFDQDVMKRPYVAQTEKAIPVRIEKEEAVKQTPPRIKLSSKYESLKSFKSERQLKENRSNSRLKLRDYIYMVEASSKAKSKRLSQKYMKIQPAKPAPTFSQEASPAIEKSKYDRGDCNIRKQCTKTKYNATNRMMFDILKEEIFTEIDMAESTINSVRQELQNFVPSLEPSNEELLILYNLRREMKQEINRKLQSTLLSLRSQKQSQSPNPNHRSNPT